MPENGSIAPDTILAAVADRTRLRILHLLSTGELCVCDLVEVLRLPQPKVSRHLAVLRSAGLVQMRIERNWRHYRIAQRLTPLHKCVLACVSCCAGELPELPRDLQRASRIAACCAPTVKIGIKPRKRGT